MVTEIVSTVSSVFVSEAHTNRFCIYRQYTYIAYIFAHWVRINLKTLGAHLNIVKFSTISHENIYMIRTCNMHGTGSCSLFPCLGGSFYSPIFY